MRINKTFLDGILHDVGEHKVARAKAYIEQEKVEIMNLNYENNLSFEIKSKVIGSKVYDTYIDVKNGEVENIHCQCLEHQRENCICKHILASIIYFAENKNITVKKENSLESKKIEKAINNDFKSFKQLINTFYNEEIENIEDVKDINIKEKNNIKLEPKVIFDKFKADIKLEFKMGNKKMYKIKDLSEFYTNMINQEFYKYGEKLQFLHKKEAFKEESRPLLDLLLKYAEMMKIINNNSESSYRYYGKTSSDSSITLGNSGIDELFEILQEQRVEFQKDYKTKEVEFTNKQPKIEFILNKVSDDKYVIEPNIEIFNVNIIKGKEFKYILLEDKFHRCTKEFENTNLRLLELFRQNYMTEVVFSKKELSQFFSIIMPKVKDAIIIKNMEKDEIEKYEPKELIIKVFFDFDNKDYLVADVKFIYGEKEFNPLDEKVKIDFPRNIIKETKALNIFRKTGFMFDSKNLRFIIPNDENIYKFLSEEIDIYMKEFEVMATDKFKQKQIKQPKMGNVGVRVENDLLAINLSNLDVDSSEIRDVLEKYQMKKKYYRLKDGSFISLENNKEIEFLNSMITGMGIEYETIEEGEIRLPVNRSLYLEQLLKNVKQTEISRNSEYKKIVNDLDKENLNELEIPKNLNNILRFYQKTGFKWLKTIDNYGFGGILADDMGLGKTIQILSIISEYIETKKKSSIDINSKRASLVISPSSLTLNWENESKKFATGLNVAVVRGTLAERKQIIDAIQDYDLVITSYDLLKRDIEIYKQKDYCFKYIVADEAQYLKNSNTQNAKCIKQLKSQTRYALTGTPIENSLAELWSIFDFIMPGYLFTYKMFKSGYEVPIVKDEDEETLEKLKMLIEPFVLRRTKKEVLTELPDKTISVLYNQMAEEQEKIYLSYLANIKEDVAEYIKVNGVEKSHIQILAAITRLRQICCHPSLFVDNYKDESSKLEQCMEILDEAIEGNHKILLFSGYTSMFPIIEERLKEKNVKYFKLTGSTKVEDRVKLVDEFNENKDIKVFLISLKAGGTGLNLTGADMVIHYDPWWNISTENQATDRAYRIGQKNNVQVYKLITKNSIEEKIYELQQKKASLTDSVLSTKVSFISKLSKEEIMSLFN